VRDPLEQAQHVRDEVLVAARQQPQAVQNGRKQAGRVGAAAEPEHEDLIARLPLLHQELVRLLDLPEDPRIERQAHERRDLLSNRGPRAGSGSVPTPGS
jgi:hypothetical protein